MINDAWNSFINRTSAKNEKPFVFVLFRPQAQKRRKTGSPQMEVARVSNILTTNNIQILAKRLFIFIYLLSDTSRAWNVLERYTLWIKQKHIHEWSEINKSKIESDSFSLSIKYRFQTRGILFWVEKWFSTKSLPSRSISHFLMDFENKHTWFFQHLTWDKLFEQIENHKARN